MPPEAHFDPKQMQQAADQAAELLKVLANANRLVLMCLLTQGELSVSDLELRSGISQPSLSQQLGVLRLKNLVVTRKQGKQVYYLLSNPEALALLSTLYALFCDPQTQALQTAKPTDAFQSVAANEDQPL